MADSYKMVESLMSIDPNFVDLCDMLFGDAVEPSDVWQFMYAPDGVSKMMPSPSDVHVPSGLDIEPRRRKRRGRLVARGDAVEKSDGRESIVWAGEFSKMDDDKRQVFGWASVVEINGEPVVDKQGDLITPEELEKAAYKYVEASRKGGHQHRRDGDQPFHASNMIESFVITPEKIEKMGLPDSTPCGWWVGYKVHDDDTWVKIKKGDVTGFSIHGNGKRREA